MKLAILTQYYPPEIGAPQARLSEIAQHFVRAGHEVTVLTAMPNYPAGKVYAGYGGLYRQEVMHGVEVKRTFIYPTKKTDFIRRLSNYFSFVFSSALMGSVCLSRPDYLLVESPPLFMGFSGIWLKWLKRTRLIFNVSDLWPESAVRLNMLNRDGLAHRLSSRFEAFCYRQAWLITGQSKGILADISERFPERPVFHLSNGVDTQKFGPSNSNQDSRKLIGNDGECVALYAGLHGLAQGLDQLLDAAEMLRHENTLRFTLVGDGPEKNKLLLRAKSAELENVRFLDSCPASEIPGLVASADIAVVILKTELPGAVPSKLYEAMASARPVVLVAEGEPARIVNEHQAGITVAPGDIEGLARSLLSLRSNPELRRTLGANGRRAAEAMFDRSAIVGRFIEFLETNLHVATTRTVTRGGEAAEGLSS